MKSTVLLFCLVLIISVVQGKHLHPRSLVRLGEIEVEDDNISEKIAEIDAVRNIRPNRFVPINSVFFKMYPPCEKGLKRDLLGICRVVWE